MKILLGIIIGIIATLTIRQAHADSNKWKLTEESNVVVRFQDGNVNCYIASFRAYGFFNNYTISCVKVR